MLKETRNRGASRPELADRGRGPKRREKQAIAEMERMENLEELLMARSKKINEGKDGVILEIDLSTPLIIKRRESSKKQKIAEAGVEPQEVIVGKILKIYSAGAGQKEYEIQKTARRAIAGNDFVRVPRAYFYKRLLVSNDRFRKFLESVGFAKDEGRKNVELVAMERIQGKDLDQFAYEQFILAYADAPQFSGQCPARSWKKYFHSANKQELRDFILDKLDLPVSNLADKAVIEGLRGRGLLPPEIYDGLKKALRSMHQAGVYHRDMHPGNLMKERRNGQIGLCLIDFGTATTIDPHARRKNEAEIYDRHTPDEKVLEFVKALSEKSKPRKLEDILQQLKEEF